MTDEEIDGLDPVSTSLASQATELEAQLATARAEVERLHALFVGARAEAEWAKKDAEAWRTRYNEEVSAWAEKSLRAENRLSVAQAEAATERDEMKKRTEVAEDKVARRIQYSLRLRALVVDALDITTGKKTLAFTANWTREARAALEEGLVERMRAK